MSPTPKRKPAPRKEKMSAAKGVAKRGKPIKRKHEDSDDIERAVYDGMLDLRVKQPR